jgi:hypothetical protein
LKINTYFSDWDDGYEEPEDEVRPVKPGPDEED